MRELQPTKKDYKEYVQCFYRTDYSYEIDKKSSELSGPLFFEEDEEGRTDFLDNSPTFEEYCRNFDWLQYNSKILVYENDKGEDVAITEVRKRGKALHIDLFFVDIEHQLCGYGRRFYEEIEQKARDLHFKKITLFCNFDGSRMFWLKMGFIDTGVFVKKL